MSEEGHTHLMRDPRVGKSLSLVLILLAVFLLVITIGEIKAYKFIGGGVPTSNTISVTGTGEAFAVPDVASFSFSVNEERDTVAQAQDEAAQKMNIALALLEDAGVEDKDIQTTGYNIYPQYDFIREVCTQFSCPPGRQELRGYQVTQTIRVNVRDTEKAGDILADIGSVGVTNVSGLSFTVSDEDAPLREARQEAIDKAQDKAEQLADDLGVKLVRIVSFSEGGGGGFAKRFDTFAMEAVADSAAVAVPEIPVGENKISSTVTITYEIR